MDDGQGVEVLAALLGTGGALFEDAVSGQGEGGEEKEDACYKRMTAPQGHHHQPPKCIASDTGEKGDRERHTFFMRRKQLVEAPTEGAGDDGQQQQDGEGGEGVFHGSGASMADEAPALQLGAVFLRLRCGSAVAIRK